MFQSHIRMDRKMCVLVALLSLIIAGMRVSDVRVLLAIAQGKGINDPAFSTPSSQYVWDSPLKVVLVKSSPPNLVSIVLIFAGLALLPLLGLLARESSIIFYLTAVLTALTPALKISFQNIGVGDGLVYVLTLFAVATSSRFVVFSSFLLLGLWHPQQAFFIGGTYLLYSSIYDSGLARQRMVWATFGLLIAGIAFILYKVSLGFQYYDRVSYIADRLYELPLRNLSTLPVSGFYIVFWGYIVHKMLPLVRPPLYGIAWSFILVAVAILTADVTRVISIVALPALVIPMKRIYLDLHEKGTEQSLQLPLIWIVLSILMPAYSWSGFDIFVWPDILNDLCKINVVCITGWQ